MKPTIPPGSKGSIQRNAPELDIYEELAAVRSELQRTLKDEINMKSSKPRGKPSAVNRKTSVSSVEVHTAQSMNAQDREAFAPIAIAPAIPRRQTRVTRTGSIDNSSQETLTGDSFAPLNAEINELDGRSSQYATLPFSRGNGTDSMARPYAHSYSSSDLSNLGQSSHFDGVASHVRNLHSSASGYQVTNGFSPASAFQAVSFREPALHSSASGSRGSMYEPMDRFSNDLTQWQQQHKEHLMKQHESISKFVGYGNVSSSRPFPVNLNFGSDPHKLEAIRAAADNIIQAKDQIIEQQHMKILQLEEQRGSGGGQRYLLGKAQDEVYSLNSKLENSLMDNARLRSQLNDARSSKTSDYQSLERKLAATEYQLAQQSMDQERYHKDRSREVEDLRQQLSLGNHSVGEWKDRHASLARECEELRKKVRSLENFLMDLPSKDECLNMNNELRALRDQKTEYIQRLQDTERKMKQLQGENKSRGDLIEVLEETNRDLSREISTIKKEKEAFQKEVAQLRESGAFIPDEKIKQVEDERDGLQEKCNKVKKMIESMQRKNQQMEVQHQQQLVEMQQRLDREEEQVLILRREVNGKEQDIDKLKDKVHELEQQKQDFLSKEMHLQDRVSAYELQFNSEVETLQYKLLRELQICFKELNSLVKVCMQMSKGDDPNVTDLLGLGDANDLSTATACNSEAAQSLEDKIEMIYQLRKDIDHIRDTLSIQYADHLGENLSLSQCHLQ